MQLGLISPIPLLMKLQLSGTSPIAAGFKVMTVDV